MRRSVILAFAAALTSQPSLADLTVPPNRPGAYAPRDACSRIPGARAFAASLRSAIAQRDAPALVNLAASDVRLDFGGGSGKALLRSQLMGKDGAALWRELDEAVRLGCALDSGEMVFPWVFAQNLGDIDPFDALVVTGPAVPLYRRADARSAPIARLNWQMVVAQGDGASPGADKRSMRRISVIRASCC